MDRFTYILKHNFSEPSNFVTRIVHLPKRYVTTPSLSAGLQYAICTEKGREFVVNTIHALAVISPRPDRVWSLDANGCCLRVPRGGAVCLAGPCSPRVDGRGAACLVGFCAASFDAHPVGFSARAGGFHLTHVSCRALGGDWVIPKRRRSWSWFSQKLGDEAFEHWVFLGKKLWMEVGDTRKVGGMRRLAQKEDHPPFI